MRCHKFVYTIEVNFKEFMGSPKGEKKSDNGGLELEG